MSGLPLLFWIFFKISLFSVGGGYNMIPLMQHEMAAGGWLTAEQFMNVLAISEATPGPIAVNLATFAGYQAAGGAGALVATIGVCLPGAILLLALGALAIRLRDRPEFRAAMRGVMPVLAGLLAATTIRLWMSVTPPDRVLPAPFTIVIFLAAFGLVLRRNPHPVRLLAGAAAAGMLFRLAA